MSRHSHRKELDSTAFEVHSNRTNPNTENTPMITRMWMSKPVLTVEPDATVTDAALLMGKHHIRRLLVVQRSGEKEVIRGIVSKHDILHASPKSINPFLQAPPEDAPTQRITEIMTKEVQTIHPDAPLEEAAIQMRDRKIGALPVTVGTQLVGILTESDLFRAFTALLSEGEDTLRVTFDLTEGEEVLTLAMQQARKQRLRFLSVVTFEWKGKRLAVTRIQGKRAPQFVHHLWSTGHTVLDVTPPLKDIATESE